MRKCVLWDFDGTLARRSGLWSGALLETVKRFEPSAPCELSVLKAHLQRGFPWHRPDIEHAQLCHPDTWWEALYPVLARALVAGGVSEALASQLAREARSVYLDPAAWHVFEDVVPSLGALDRLGWEHAVLSNHVPELSLLMSELGIRDRFIDVFSSASFGFEKPNAQAFRYAQKVLGDPQVLWMVGDSFTVDVLGANRAGLRAVLVRSRHDEATYQCDSLVDLANVLAG